MEEMKKALKEQGYKKVQSTEDYGLYVNNELEQTVLLFPNLSYDSPFMDEVLEALNTCPHKKRTVAFIGDTNETGKDRVEIFADEFWFIKIEGYREDLIPRKTDKTVVSFPIDGPLEEGLFYDPYKSMKDNLLTLVSALNSEGPKEIRYGYPRPILLTLMPYVKYFLMNKAEYTMLEEVE